MHCIISLDDHDAARPTSGTRRHDSSRLHNLHQNSNHHVLNAVERQHAAIICSQPQISFRNLSLTVITSFCIMSMH